MKPLKALGLLWDLKTKRYKAFKAKTKEDIEACVTILEEVRLKELNRVVGASVLQSSAFAEKELDFVLFACKDSKTNEVAGCIRVTKASDIFSSESARQEYELDLFDTETIDRLNIFTRLAVKRSYRNSPVALVLMAHAFTDALYNGGVGILMSCEPNLFNMYMRLGLRPLGEVHNSRSGGYRIPMICLPDYDYMKSIKTPALPLLKKVKWSKYDAINQWYKKLVEQKGGILKRSSMYRMIDNDKDVHLPLTQGLSKGGLSVFFSNAMSVVCNKGDLIIAAKDGGKYVGIVRSGSVIVQMDDKPIATLRKGEIFGEIAFILNQRRSADIIAANPATEVILLSASILKKMKNKKDRTTIWKNLAVILCEKIITTNGTLIDVYKNLNHQRDSSPQPKFQ